MFISLSCEDVADALSLCDVEMEQIAPLSGTGNISLHVDNNVASIYEDTSIVFQQAKI